MAIHLEENKLVNRQQMEVAVNGPDGATHLLLCTGVANLSCTPHETYTFLVGPQLTRRQFVAVIASGAWCHFQASEYLPTGQNQSTPIQANLCTITGEYDEASSQVKISAEVALGPRITQIAISYSVSILAELKKRL